MILLLQATDQPHVLTGPSFPFYILETASIEHLFPGSPSRPELMSTEEIKRLNEIIDQALSYPPSERTHYLDRVCNDEPALRNRIEQLIDGCEREAPEEFLNTPFASKELFDQLFDELDDEDDDVKTGTDE